MRAGEAGQEPVERPDCWTEECLRHADRWRDPDRVAIAGDVLDRDPAFVAGDPGPHRPPRGGELGEPGVGGGPVLEHAGRDLFGREVAEAPQEVMRLVDGRGQAVVGKTLQRELQVGQRIGIEQLAQLLLAEQLAQEVAIEREGARAPLGERRVAVVHVGRDVIEEEAARERARLARSRRHGRRSRGWRRPTGSRAAHRGRTRPTGTRDTSRRGSGSCRSGWRPPAGRPTAGAAARAGCGSRAGDAAGAGRGPRSPGIGWRTGPSSRPARRRGPRPHRPRGTATPRRPRSRRRPRAGGSRCRRRTRSSRPPCRGARAVGPPAPSTTARGRAHRTA